MEEIKGAAGVSAKSHRQLLDAKAKHWVNDQGQAYIGIYRRYLNSELREAAEALYDAKLVCFEDRLSGSRWTTLPPPNPVNIVQHNYRQELLEAGARYRYDADHRESFIAIPQKLFSARLREAASKAYGARVTYLEDARYGQGWGPLPAPPQAQPEPEIAPKMRAEYSQRLRDARVYLRSAADGAHAGIGRKRDSKQLREALSILLPTHRVVYLEDWKDIPLSAWTPYRGISEEVYAA